MRWPCRHAAAEEERKRERENKEKGGGKMRQRTGLRIKAVDVSYYV
jgi:hypothetical protein